MDRRERIRQVRGVASLLVLYLLSVVSTHADEPVRPLPPDAAPYGMTIPEWSAAQGQWFHSIPRSVHPREDRSGSGQFSAIGQRAPVWFLTSPFMTGADIDTAVRRTIPSGVSLFFPIIANLWIAEPASANESFMRQGARSEMSLIRALELSINGVTVPNLRQYRAQSTFFTVLLSPDNIERLPVKEGEVRPMKVVMDGYWIFLPPLPPGEHVIRMRGERGPAPRWGRTVHLTVLAP